MKVDAEGVIRSIGGNACVVKMFFFVIKTLLILSIIGLHSNAERSVFKTCDQNYDRQLSRGELNYCLSKTDVQYGFREVGLDVDTILQLLDIDEDGKISSSEYEKILSISSTMDESVDLGRSNSLNNEVTSLEADLELRDGTVMTVTRDELLGMVQESYDLKEDLENNKETVNEDEVDLSVLRDKNPNIAKFIDMAQWALDKLSKHYETLRISHGKSKTKSKNSMKQYRHFPTHSKMHEIRSLPPGGSINRSQSYLQDSISEESIYQKSFDMYFEFSLRIPHRPGSLEKYEIRVIKDAKKYRYPHIVVEQCWLLDDFGERKVQLEVPIHSLFITDDNDDTTIMGRVQSLYRVFTKVTRNSIMHVFLSTSGMEMATDLETPPSLLISALVIQAVVLSLLLFVRYIASPLMFLCGSFIYWPTLKEEVESDVDESVKQDMYRFPVIASIFIVMGVLLIFLPLSSSLPTKRILVSDRFVNLNQIQKIFADKDMMIDIKVNLSDRELKSVIGQYDGILIRSATKLTEEILKNSKSLKVVGRAGVGLDNVPTDYCLQNNIKVFNSPRGNVQATAEMTVALMLSLARHVHEANRVMKEEEEAFEKYRNDLVGMQLSGKTLGIIGCGNIGQRVGKICNCGFNMNVIARPSSTVSKSELQRMGIEQVDDLSSLLKNSDIVSIHVPLLENTRDLIDDKALAMMKSSALLINCARGGVVNELHLRDALISRTIKGAAVDVYQIEPCNSEKDSVLLQKGIPNLLLTPHLGASTVESQENVAIDAATQMAEYLESEYNR